MEKLKTEFKTEWRKPSFKLLAISSFLVFLLIVVMWLKHIKNITTGIIILHALWIITYCYYEFGKERAGSWKQSDIYILLLNLFALAGMFVAKSSDLNLMAYYLVATMTLFFAGSFIYTLIALIYARSRSPWIILIGYTIVIFTLITLFSWLYTIMPAVMHNESDGVFTTINQTSKQELQTFERANGVWNYWYFSFCVAFNVSFGDLVPIGRSIQNLVMLEIFCFVVIVGTVLNVLLSRPAERNERPSVQEMHISKMRALRGNKY